MTKDKLVPKIPRVKTGMMKFSTKMDVPLRRKIAIPKVTKKY